MIRAFLLSLTLVVGGSPAFAQGAPDTSGTPAPAQTNVPLAESFELSGQYREAAVEYQRSAMLLPDSMSGSRHLAILKAADCYRLAGLYALASRQLERLEAEPALADSFAARASLLRAFCLRDQGDHRGALVALGLEGGTPREMPPAHRLMAAGELLHLRRWKPAQDLLRGGDPGTDGSSFEEGRQRLISLAQEGAVLKTPRPAIAVLLSAVLPGAGRAYAGHRAEGINSLVLHAVTTWQAVVGFRRDGTRSTRGWIAVGTGVVFYAGDLYGSAVTATRAAQGKWNEFSKRVDEAVARGLMP
jgi:hypothetical protein